MAACRQCGQEIADDAAVCEHCGALVGAVRRPPGVTVIAILVLVGAGLAILAVPALKAEFSALLGIRVPVFLAQVVMLVFAGLSIYCGVGLLQLKRVAKTIYIWVAVYDIVDSLVCGSVLTSTIPDSLPSQMRPMFFTSVWVGVVVGVGLNAFILYYLLSRRKYFVN